MVNNGHFEWENNVTASKMPFTCIAVKGGSKAVFSSFVGTDVTKTTCTIRGGRVDIDYSEVSYFYV